MCACGKPLHYADPIMQQMVQQLVDEKGESMKVVIGKRAWMVQRHYIALHGLKTRELEALGFPEVTGSN